MQALLGHGTFGKVALILDKAGGQHALKVVNKASYIQADAVSRLLNERKILILVRCHPFIITLFAAFQSLVRLFK